MEQGALWPILVYFIIALIIVSGMIGLSYFLGQQGRSSSKNEPYESGIKITGSARLRFPSKFYLIAMFFVLFDIETAFIVAWAISIKELGWAGYIGASIFIGILLVVLLYEWRLGALDFGPVGKKILKAIQKNQKTKST